MSKSRTDTAYAFVAAVARLLPEATFHGDKLHLRDGTTRINVQVGDKNRLFIVAKMVLANHKEVSTPQDAVDHFLAPWHCGYKMTRAKTAEPGWAPGWLCVVKSCSRHRLPDGGR